jgi:hypothetical protein
MMQAHMFLFVSWLISLQCTYIVCSSFHGMHTVAMYGHRLTLAQQLVADGHYLHVTSKRASVDVCRPFMSHFIHHILHNARCTYLGV